MNTIRKSVLPEVVADLNEAPEIIELMRSLESGITYASATIPLSLKKHRIYTHGPTGRNRYELDSRQAELKARLREFLMRNNLDVDELDYEQEKLDGKLSGLSSDTTFWHTDHSLHFGRGGTGIATLGLEGEIEMVTEISDQLREEIAAQGLTAHLFPTEHASALQAISRGTAKVTELKEWVIYRMNEDNFHRRENKAATGIRHTIIGQF